MFTYPNPVRDYLTVDLPEGTGSGQLYILDMDGRLIWEEQTRSIQTSLRLDMSDYEVGTYSVEYVPEDNVERRVWTSSVVVVR